MWFKCTIGYICTFVLVLPYKQFFFFFGLCICHRRWHTCFILHVTALQYSSDLGSVLKRDVRLMCMQFVGSGCSINIHTNSVCVSVWRKKALFIVLFKNFFVAGERESWSPGSKAVPGSHWGMRSYKGRQSFSPGCGRSSSQVCPPIY